MDIAHVSERCILHSCNVKQQRVRPDAPGDMAETFHLTLFTEADIIFNRAVPT